MNHMKDKPPCWLINDDFLDLMLRSSKCRRRRKHIGNNTWSVTIVIFLRTRRQHWTQPVVRSENSFSFMIFQPFHWTSFGQNGLQKADNRRRKANEGGIQIEKRKQGVLISTYLDFKPTSLFWACEVNASRKPRPTNCRKTMDMGLLAVSIYQRPKSKQELQVISFTPNATATAVEQPAAEFGPGIAQERCVRSPNRGTNYMT